MEAPRISMVTVVLNGAKHLDQCINSVLGQEYPNLEYIIVDGGSEDGSVEIIKKYENHLKYWVSEKDNGISDAFNKGICAATGEIIGFINADDWLEPAALDQVAKASTGAGIIYGKLKQWRKKQMFIADARDDLLWQKMSLNHPATFVKKSVYDEIGMFDTSYRVAMDYEFLLRAKKNGIVFKKVDCTLANMRLEGASEANWLKGLEEVRKAKDKHLGRKVENLLDFYRNAIQVVVSRTLLDSPLAPLFNLYRKRFSAIRKTGSNQHWPKLL